MEPRTAEGWILVSFRPSSSVHCFCSTIPSLPELGRGTQASPSATPSHHPLSGWSGPQCRSSPAWERTCISVTALILYYDYDRLNFPQIATVMFPIFQVPSALFLELCHSLLRIGVYTPPPLNLAGILQWPPWVEWGGRDTIGLLRLGHPEQYSFCLALSFSRYQPMQPSPGHMERPCVPADSTC